MPERGGYEERLGDLLARQRLSSDGVRSDGVEVVVESHSAAHEQLPLLVVESPAARDGEAVLERNLARHGGWWTEGGGPCEEEVLWEDEDRLGSIVVSYGLGRLTVSDLHLVAWLLGRWRQDEDEIAFSARICSREMGIAWHGRRRAELLTQLGRIDRTRFTTRVWCASTRTWEERTFGVISGYTARERRAARNEPSTQGTLIRVRLDPFIEESLRQGNRVCIPWRRLLALRSSDLARRLLWYVDSQKGWPDDSPGSSVYEMTVDRQLQATLGNRQAKIRDFRAALLAAARRVEAVDPRYSFSLRRRARGVWVLSAARG